MIDNQRNNENKELLKPPSFTALRVALEGISSRGNKLTSVQWNKIPKGCPERHICVMPL